MDFEEFKNLHTKFSKALQQGKLLPEDLHELYIDELHGNKKYSNWVLKKKLKENDFDFSEFCCVKMASHIFDSFNEFGEIKYEDHDIIMNKWEDGTFGIPIHDGGSSVIKINFCPWCGTKLSDE